MDPAPLPRRQGDGLSGAGLRGGGRGLGFPLALLGTAAMTVLVVPGCGGASTPDAIAVDLSTPPPPLAAASGASADAAPPGGAATPAARPGEPAPGTYEIYPGVAVPEAWVDCSTNDDCAIVTAGCCDHCNGGAITTVNKAFAEAARAKIDAVTKPATGCGGCTKRGCDAASSHQLVCMTRACHFDDLEEEVQERIWGKGTPEEGVPAVTDGGVIERVR